MVQRSMFWNTDGTGDGPAGGYPQARIYDFFKKVFIGDQEASEGVLRLVDNELVVSGTASPLSVAVGSAIVRGFFFESTSNENLVVATPSVGLTGGHVIIRADWTARTVRLVAVRNTDGVAGIPTLVQSDGATWEIRLATFTITTGGVITLTDARNFSNYSTSVSADMLENNSVVAGKLADGAVNTTAKLADNVVDDTKAGNRMPQLYRRQGGNASSWSSEGETAFAPGAVRMQVGSKSVSISGNTTVTFPFAYPNTPVVFTQAFFGAPPGTFLTVTGVAPGSFTMKMYDAAGNQIAGSAFWMSVGSET